MKYRKLFLRIAAALMLFHTIGHSIGALTWKEPSSATMRGVIDGMVQNHFTFMGRSTSLGLFYDGYGISMIFVLLFITILLVFLSLELPSRLVLRVQWLLVIFLACLGVTEYIYFFAIAAICSLLAGTFTLIACKPYANK